MIVAKRPRTFQTSFTPSAQICGFRPSRPKWSMAAPVRWPGVPSARTVIRAVMSAPGSKLPSGSPSLPRPLSPVRTPSDAAVRDEQLLRGGLGQDRRAGRLRLLGEEPAELGDRDDPVAVVHHRRRRRNPERGALREQVDGLAVDLAVVRHLLHRQPAGEEPAERARVHHGAREEVRARLLALLEHGDRHVAELLAPSPGAPRAAGRAGSRRRARRARRRRSGRRPRCARRPGRSARRSPRRSSKGGG